MRTLDSIVAGFGLHLDGHAANMLSRQYRSPPTDQNSRMKWAWQHVGSVTVKMKTEPS